jgi:AcrR family transcriptional regulator
VTAVRSPHRLGPHRDPAVDTVVLAAARELVGEIGYARTTVDGIARAAGVSRPAIYRRWPSKALLVHEAVFPYDPMADAAPAPFAEELARLVRGALEFFATAPARAAVPALMAELHGDPELRELFARRLEHAARQRFATEVVATGVVRGEIRPDLDPDVVIDAMTGAVIFATCVRDVDDLEAFATALTALLLHGAAARS